MEVEGLIISFPKIQRVAKLIPIQESMISYQLFSQFMYLFSRYRSAPENSLVTDKQ